MGFRVGAGAGGWDTEFGVGTQTLGAELPLASLLRRRFVIPKMSSN
jgi:hypothetical protein